MRQEELENAAFGVVHDILLRDLHGTLQPTDNELAALLAISNCADALAETRAFARNAWEWLVYPDGQQPAAAKLSIALRAREAIRSIRRSQAQLLEDELLSA